MAALSVSVQTNSETEATASWNPPELAGQTLVRYDVEYCQRSGSSCAGSKSTLTTSSESRTITGLVHKTNYRVRARAVTKADGLDPFNGEFSSWRNFVTHGAPETISGAPTVSTSFDRRPDQIVIQWAVPTHYGAGVSSYTIEIDGAITKTSTRAQYIDSGLIQGPVLRIMRARRA